MTVTPDPCPAFQIVNPDGSAPILFLCDHACRALPAGYGTLGLDPAELWRHIAWDIGALDVAQDLARRFDAPLVHSTWSRLLIDCNRAPHSGSFIWTESDGTAVPGNADLTPEERARRQTLYYDPYHQAIEDQLARFRARGVVPAVISVHSFTPVMNGLRRPWHIGILWDRDPRIAVPLMDALRQPGDIVVGDNQPYSARDHNGDTVERHAHSQGLPNVLIEIRQDLIDTHHGAADWADRIARALLLVLGPAPLFAIARY